MHVAFILLEKKDFFETSIFIIIWSVIYDFTMPSKNNLCLTQSQKGTLVSYERIRIRLVFEFRWQWKISFSYVLQRKKKYLSMT